MENNIEYLTQTAATKISSFLCRWLDRYTFLTLDGSRYGAEYMRDNRLITMSIISKQ